MSISYTGEVCTLAATPGGGGGATTQAMTVALSPGAGDLVLIGACPTNFGISSIADSRGNLWRKANAHSNATATELWYTVQDAGRLLVGDTITFTFAGTVFNIAALVEAFASTTGWLANPFDVTSSANGTTTARDGGTTAATAQSSELAIGVFTIAGAETSFTPGSGYSTPTTAFKNLGTTLAIEMEYQVLSATGTPHATGTGGASTGSSGVTATFKTAAAVAGGLNTLALLGVGS